MMVCCWKTCMACLLACCVLDQEPYGLKAIKRGGACRRAPRTCRIYVLWKLQSSTDLTRVTSSAASLSHNDVTHQHDRCGDTVSMYRRRAPATWCSLIGIPHLWFHDRGFLPRRHVMRYELCYFLVIIIVISWAVYELWYVAYGRRGKVAGCCIHVSIAAWLMFILYLIAPKTESRLYVNRSWIAFTTMPLSNYKATNLATRLQIIGICNYRL